MPQPQPPHASCLSQPAPPWIARIVGFVALAIGPALLGLSTLGVFQGLTSEPTPRPALVVVLTIVSLIGLLCTLVGRRLVTGRSPHGDSLLSRAVWTLLGSGFVAIGIGFVVALPWNGDLVGYVLPSAFLATGCFGVAARPRRP